MRHFSGLDAIAARIATDSLAPTQSRRALLAGDDDGPDRAASGRKGGVLHPVKKVLRRLMRSYVEPLAADQRAFNDAALKRVFGFERG